MSLENHEYLPNCKYDKLCKVGKKKKKIIAEESENRRIRSRTIHDLHGVYAM